MTIKMSGVYIPNRVARGKVLCRKSKSCAYYTHQMVFYIHNIHLRRCILLLYPLVQREGFSKILVTSSVIRKQSTSAASALLYSTGLQVYDLVDKYNNKVHMFGHLYVICLVLIGESLFESTMHSKSAHHIYIYIYIYI